MGCSARSACASVRAKSKNRVNPKNRDGEQWRDVISPRDDFGDFLCFFFFGFSNSPFRFVSARIRFADDVENAEDRRLRRKTKEAAGEKGLRRKEEARGGKGERMRK